MELITSFTRYPVIVSLFAPLLMLVMIVLFWWRAGSIHSLLERFWQFIAGKGDIHDPELKEFLQKNRDMEKIRFILRLKLDDPEDVVKLRDWQKRFRVPIASIQKARRWFDIRTNEVVTSPPKSFFRQKGGWMILIGLTILGASVLMTSKSALLKMNGSGTWFLSDVKNIREPALFGGWSIGLESCRSNLEGLAKISGFSLSEVTALCQGVDSGSYKKYVESTIHDQNVVAVAGEILAVLAMFMVLYQMMGAEEARKIEMQVKAVIENEQAEKKDINVIPVISRTSGRQRKRDKSSIENSSAFEIEISVSPNSEVIPSTMAASVEKKIPTK